MNSSIVADFQPTCIICNYKPFSLALLLLSSERQQLPHLWGYVSSEEQGHYDPFDCVLDCQTSCLRPPLFGHVKMARYERKNHVARSSLLLATSKHRVFWLRIVCLQATKDTHDCDISYYCLLSMMLRAARWCIGMRSCCINF